MLGLETKKAFVALHPADISPPTQPDGRDSLKAARELIRQAYTEGAISFEWEHKRADGSQFPVDVRLTPFSYN